MPACAVLFAHTLLYFLKRMDTHTLSHSPQSSDRIVKVIVCPEVAANQSRHVETFNKPLCYSTLSGQNSRDSKQPKGTIRCSSGGGKGFAGVQNGTPSTAAMQVMTYNKESCVTPEIPRGGLSGARVGEKRRQGNNNRINAQVQRTPHVCHPLLLLCVTSGCEVPPLSGRRAWPPSSVQGLGKAGGVVEHVLGTQVSTAVRWVQD